MDINNDNDAPAAQPASEPPPELEAQVRRAVSKLINVLEIPYPDIKWPFASMVNIITDELNSASRPAQEQARLVAEKAGAEIARRVNTQIYPPTLTLLMSDPSIVNEKAFADWLTAIILEALGGVVAPLCECGHDRSKHQFFSDHDECYECVAVENAINDGLCCEYRPAHLREAQDEPHFTCS